MFGKNLAISWPAGAQIAAASIVAIGGLSLTTSGVWAALQATADNSGNPLATSTGTFTSGGNPVVRTIPFVMTNVTTVDLAKWTMRTTTSNIGPNRNYQIKICTAAYTGLVCGGTETILQAASNTNVSNSDSVKAALPAGPTTYQGLIVVTKTNGATTGATSVTLRATVTNAIASTDLGAAATVSN